MDIKEDINGVELKAQQIEAIMSVFFLDNRIPEEDLSAVRQWLAQNEFAELKDKSLFEEFAKIYRYSKNPKYAEELWGEVANRLGMPQDLSEILAKAAANGYSASIPEANVDEMPQTKIPEKTAKRAVSLKRWTTRVAAVVLPGLMAVGLAVYLLAKGPSAEMPLVADATVEAPVENVEALPVIVADVVEQPAPAPAVVVSTPISSRRRTSDVIYDIKVNAPKDHSRFVTLPDNSTVLINNGGSIEYSSEHRELKLIGEAFFQIEKGHDKIFQVKTEFCSINVKGTEFDVKAHSGSDESVINLVNGSVEVVTKTNKVSIRPTEQLRLNNTSGAVKISRMETNNWWKQSLNFDSESLCGILGYLEGCYATTIHGREQISDTVAYTIKFDRLSSLEHIMSTLMQVAPGFEYSMDDSGVIVSMNTPKI